MFYIVKIGETGLIETYHKRRNVWQWFYDSANVGWKTETGAFKALCKLYEKYPTEFENATITKGA